MSKPAILQVKGLLKNYQQGNRTLAVLRGVDVTMRAGEIVALMGASGSGKSTLLQVTGLLDQANGGEIMFEDRPVLHLSDEQRTLLRRRRIGFIYQFHHLLPEFTARENILMPMRIAGTAEREAGRRADELLAEVGLSGRADHLPSELSGGEAQRVAIARAFANSPKLVLADEPTGNLDPATAGQVFEWFLTMARAYGVALLMATHNPDLAKRADRMLKMENGLIVHV